MITPEYHGMHNMQSEFVTQGTFKAESKTFQVQHFKKTGNTKSMESGSDDCSLDKRSRNKAMNKGNAKRERLERLDAHHTSSSDSCSRSTFFRSPTSEVQTFLCLDLTNQVIKAYIVPMTTKIDP